MQAHRSKTIAMILAALWIALAGAFAACAAEEDFVIHFLDVGQADSAIVVCEGHAMIIDGGNAGDSQLVYAYLRENLGIRHLDYMIATHPHEDHIGGLAAALNACSVGAIYCPVTEYDSKAFASMLKYAGQQGVVLTNPQVGDTITLGSATVEFLSNGQGYSDVNDQSLVCRVVYGETNFLFTGDAGSPVEHDLIDRGVALKSTLLKVAHHGSESSSSYVFLREVMPEYAVISVGADNKYGHPAEGTLSRLTDAGAEVLRTDMLGHIVCHSDGRELSFKAERGEIPREQSDTTLAW